MKERPAWFPRVRVRPGSLSSLRELQAASGIRTVCEGALCPNRPECYASGHLTVLILGAACTRRCRFCAVGRGFPEPPDPEEPGRVAAAVGRLGMRHVVITSVTRDDLPDGGASQYAETAAAMQRLPSASIHRPEDVSLESSHRDSPLSSPLAPPDREGGGDFWSAPSCEALIPDFLGDTDAVETVAQASFQVLAHNVETVPRLYPAVRPQAEYGRSLRVLAMLRRFAPEKIVKSGIMLGLGEVCDEVRRVMDDLRGVGVEALTLGQYLRPTPSELPVERYVGLEEFEYLAEEARLLGFRTVASGPYVRSSYRAAECLVSIDPGEGR